MIPASRLRAGQQVAQQLRLLSRQGFASSARQLEAAGAVSTPSSSASAKVPSPPQTTDTAVQPAEVTQAPNRVGVWSRSQQPRSKAMTGPRFEQTDFSLQPQPYSAMELVHQTPVNWTHDRVVVCDGARGGGPGGHPRIFINTDKAEIAVCNYCGTPYANEHHRKKLESMPETSYPLA